MLSRVDEGKHRPYKHVTTVTLSTVVYFLLALLGLELAKFGSNVSPFWPAAGVALAMQLLISRYAVAGVFLGALLNSTINSGLTFRYSIVSSLSSACYLFVLAELLRRFAKLDPQVARAGDVIKLFGLASVCVAIGASGGTLAHWLDGLPGGSVNFDKAFTYWRLWWLGDLLGILALTPLVLAWYRRGRRLPSRKTMIECVVVAAILMATCGVVFASSDLQQGVQVFLLMAIFPVMVFIALRFGPRTSTSLALFVIVAASVGTSMGLGPFALPPEAQALSGPWLLGGFQIAIAITSMTISASETASRRIRWDSDTQNRVLSAVSLISRRYLDLDDWHDGAQEAVERIGEALGVSRSYLFVNSREGDQHFTNQRFEWCAAGIEAHIDNPALQNIPWDGPILERMRDYLRNGRPYYGKVDDFGPESREYFAEQDIRSLFVAPIIVHGHWWGFVGCDDCVKERIWSDNEAAALGAVAGVIGASVGRLGALDALTSRERRFQAMAEHSQDIEIIFHPQRGVSYFSPAAERYLGVNVESILKRERTDFISPDDFEVLAPFFTQCIANPGQAINLPPFMLRHASGAWQWHEGVITNLIDTPEVAGIVGNFRNIDERMRQQQRIETSERRFRALTEHSADIVMIFDIDTRVRYASPQCHEVIGFHAEEIVGQLGTDLVHPDDLQRYHAIIKKVVESPGRAIPFAPMRYAVPDRAGWQWLEGTKINLIEDPSIAGLVCNFRNVTDRVIEHSRVESGEARLRTFMRVTQDAICYFELDAPMRVDAPIAEQVGALWDSHIVECNAAYSKEYDEEIPARMIGRRYRDLTGFRRDERLISSLFEGFVRKGYILDRIETNELTTDGKPRSYIRSVQGVTEDGKLVGYWSTAIDVSAKSEQRRALEEAQQRFRAFVEQTSEGIGYYHYDQAIDLAADRETKLAMMYQATLTDCNDAMARIRGFASAAEMRGMRAELDRNASRNGSIEEALIDNDFQVSGIENSRLRPDGSPIHVLVDARGIEIGGKIVGTWVTMKDVTDKFMREKRFRMMIENAFDGVVVYDRDGRVVDAFGAIDRVTGYTAQEIIGHSWREFEAPEDEASARPSWEEVYQKPGKPIAALVRLQRVDGQLLWVQTIKTNLLDDPYVRGVVSNFRDVTAEHEAQMRMQHTQKLESLGVLAGGIAHDFNNLLVSIQGNADLALSKLDLDSPTAKHIEHIEMASQRAADLCRQMLAYSGKGHFVIEAFDLSALVRGMAELLQVSVSSRAELKLDLAKDLPAIEGDATQIRQVIMNLITNAAEATEPNQPADASKTPQQGKTGRVTLTTSVEECDGATLEAARVEEKLSAGPYVVLRVADNGCGMTKETLDRLFEPFFTTKFSGRGLGMAAVLGIVRGHKAGIVVSSLPKIGTTFTIYLPASRKPVADISAPPSSMELQTPVESGRVLVVDDDESILMIASEMLEMLGYQVVTAASGAQAIERYQDEGPFDLLLLDLTMPNMDGAETLKRLRAIDPQVAALISSGYSEPAIRDRFAGEEHVGFIPKPYSLERLQARVSEAIEKSRP